MSELILGPIVGGLTHNSARLWARASGEGTLHAWYGEDSDLSNATPITSSQPLTEKTGYAGIITLSGLKPDTPYYYALSLEDTLPDNDIHRGTFTTFPPDRERKSFSFVFGSCVKPKGENTGSIFAKIDALRENSKDCDKHALRFILMLGDQIYADKFKHTFCKRISTTLENYQDVYKKNWAVKPFQKVLKNLPAFMTLDDHEVDDDWAWTDITRSKAYMPIWRHWGRRLRFRPKDEWTITENRIQFALQAYWEHQGMHGAGYIDSSLADKKTLNLKSTDSLASKFNYGGAAFFVLDTRTMRIKEGKKGIRMLSENQWQQLENWLKETKDSYPVKFIVTSSAFLYQVRIDFPKDRWSGYPDQRKKLLELLVENQVEGVYLLAGDLHFAHAVRADIHDNAGFEAPLWEFCSSPFQQTPNWYSIIPGFYKKLKSPLLKNQRCEISYTRKNFGVVRVDFSDQDEPKVRFEIWGDEGDIFKKEINC